MKLSEKWGRVGFLTSSKGITRVIFPGQKYTANQSAAAIKAAQKLKQYFASGKPNFRKLPFDMSRLTPFQRKVLITLLGLPAGKTISYSELAKRSGYPKASRAVGSVMSHNPFPILIPCHRVTRADGTLGNYAFGVHWKKRLLAHEKIACPA